MIRNPNSEKNEEADLWNQTNIKLLHQKAKRRKFHIVSHIDNIRLPLTKVPSDSTNDNHNDHNNRFQINEDSKQTNDPLPKRRQKNVKKDNLDLVYVFLLIWCHPIIIETHNGLLFCLSIWNIDLKFQREPKTQMNWVLVLFLLLFVGLVIYLKYNAGNDHSFLRSLNQTIHKVFSLSDFFQIRRIRSRLEYICELLQNLGSGQYCFRWDCEESVSSTFTQMASW